ncbi:hypothetical protein sos41_31590 [Alphaproteobacteria bacterium SO-S41]|nr:hypothetical protein sos41_31590 [Alphaproteobacteria bacterium SO-S41]
MEWNPDTMSIHFSKEAFDGPLNVDQVAAIRAQYKIAREADRLTHGQAAKLAGVAEGTLSSWANDTYAGDNAKVAEKVTKWLKLRADRVMRAREMVTTPPFQRTKSAQRILAILDYAQMDGDMAVIGCGPGFGKTTACEQYRMERPRVSISTMSPSSRGVSTALIMVLQSLGEKGAKGTPQALSSKICEKVSGGGALLIIDEAQHLSALAVDELRSIHDRTGVGMVFVGNQHIFDLFDGTRNVTFAQFSSRIGMREKQNRPRREDVAMIAAAWGVEEKDEADLLFKVSQQPGGLRSITKLMKLATRIAQLDSADRGLVHMLDAWEQISPTIKA